METKRDLLNHFRKLQEAVKSLNGEAYLSLQTFIVEIRLANQLYRLYPHFVTNLNGKRLFTSLFSPELDLIRFAGWRLNPGTPCIRPFSFANKLQFKNLLLQYNFVVPEYSQDSTCQLANVIIKKDASSFSENIKGPFHKSSEHALNCQDGEYYEKFVLGKIVKVWYWNHRPVCLEIKNMPYITGDGLSCIADLLSRTSIKHDLSKVSVLVSYFGRDLRTILPKGEKQIIDFRYISEFDFPEDVLEVNLLSTKDPRFEQEIWRLGEMLSNQLRSEGYGTVIYTVDAILDSEDKLCFLEANPNPFIHPDMYPVMVNGLSESSGYQPAVIGNAYSIV